MPAAASADACISSCSTRRSVSVSKLPSEVAAALVIATSSMADQCDSCPNASPGSFLRKVSLALAYSIFCLTGAVSGT